MKTTILWRRVVAFVRAKHDGGGEDVGHGVLVGVEFGVDGAQPLGPVGLFGFIAHKRRGCPTAGRALPSSPSLPERPFAPATFCGVQSGCGVMPDFELWNLTAPISGHSAGSTVSRQSIEAAGYQLPTAPETRGNL